MIARFTAIDKFAEKYISYNPYHYAGNDPILLVEIHGDSIIVDKSVTSNKQASKDFNLFAGTKAGRKFLGQYAAKGQKIGGHTYTKDGKYNKKGIDVEYRVGTNSTGEGKTTSNVDNYGGDVPVGDRLRETVTLDYSKADNSQGNNLSLEMTETLFHESFIHVDLDTKDYLDDGHLNYSNISSKAMQKAQGFKGLAQHQQIAIDFMKNGYNTLYPGQALQGLQSINQKLQTNYSVQKLLGLMEKGL